MAYHIIIIITFCREALKPILYLIPVCGIQTFGIHATDAVLRWTMREVCCIKQQLILPTQNMEYTDRDWREHSITLSTSVILFYNIFLWISSAIHTLYLVIIYMYIIYILSRLSPSRGIVRDQRTPHDTTLTYVLL